MAASSWSAANAVCSCGSLSDNGTRTGNPAESANLCTGDFSSARPRPLRRGGWVYTQPISCDAPISSASVGTANFGVPMKARRKLMRSHLPCQGSLALALQLGRFAQGDGALELGEMIDEQPPVEVIDLVLQAGREQPVGGHRLLPPVLVGIFDGEPCGPFHVVPNFRDRKAALMKGGELAGRLYDPRIDKIELLAVGASRVEVDHRYPLGHTDLDRGQTDAVLGIHGRHHVIHETA